VKAEDGGKERSWLGKTRRTYADAMSFKLSNRPWNFRLIAGLGPLRCMATGYHGFKLLAGPAVCKRALLAHPR
jgi:hypothetical protein